MLKASKEQHEALLQLNSRLRAVNAMFQRCVNEQAKVEQDTADLLQKIRLELSIPDDKEFTVKHVDGAVVIIEPAAANKQH